MEIMIVMAIIGMIAGLIGININKALKEQRFRNEVVAFTDKLRLAQNLMVILDADIHVRVRSSSEGIEYWMESERDLPSSWAAELKAPHTWMKAVHHFSLVGSQGGVSDIRFLAAGTTMTRGVIGLFPHSEKEDNGSGQYIPLSGYPRPIVALTNTNDPIIREIQESRDTQKSDHDLTVQQVNEIENLKAPAK